MWIQLKNKVIITVRFSSEDGIILVSPTLYRWFEYKGIKDENYSPYYISINNALSSYQPFLSKELNLK